eukprot:s2857_g1.t1
MTRSGGVGFSVRSQDGLRAIGILRLLGARNPMPGTGSMAPIGMAIGVATPPTEAALTEDVMVSTEFTAATSMAATLRVTKRPAAFLPQTGRSEVLKNLDREIRWTGPHQTGEDVSVGQNKSEKNTPCFNGPKQQSYPFLFVCKGFELLTHAHVKQKGVTRPPKDEPKDEPQSLWKAVAPKNGPVCRARKTNGLAQLKAQALCSRTCFPDVLQCAGGVFTLVSIVELQ